MLMARTRPEGEVRVRHVLATVAVLLHAASAGALEAGDIVGVSLADAGADSITVFAIGTRSPKDTASHFGLDGEVSVVTDGSLVVTALGFILRLATIHTPLGQVGIGVLPSGEIEEMLVLPSGEVAVLSGGAVLVYDPETFNPMDPQANEPRSFDLPDPTDIIVEDHQHLLVADGNRLIRLNFVTGAGSVVGLPVVEDIDEIALEPTGTVLVARTEFGMLEVFRFDLTSGTTTPLIEGPFFLITELAVDDSGRIFAAQSFGGLVELLPALGIQAPFTGGGNVAEFAIAPVPEPGRGMMAVLAMVLIPALARSEFLRSHAAAPPTSRAPSPPRD
jgi:hypothetical protein